jgi:branched-chain amino acid transport system ATP-binding protein
MLKLREVEVAYGHVRALAGVSIDVREGELVALLGANGAGKSSTLMTVSGIVRARSGSVTWGDADLTRAAPFDIVNLGIIQCPEGRRIFGGLSVIENLRLLAILYGLADGLKRAAQVCDLLGIDRPTTLVRSLSRGSQQRAALARALLHQPTLLLLDEPFTGLDLGAADGLGRILRGFCRDGGAILMTTHSAAEALRAADDAAVLAGGRLTTMSAVAGMDPEGLRAWYAAAAGGGAR